MPSTGTVLQIPIAGRPRLPVVGQGHILCETGSPGGRPKNAISQLPFVPQKSLTSLQEKDGQISPLTASDFRFFWLLILNMVILSQ